MFKVGKQLGILFRIVLLSWGLERLVKNNRPSVRRTAMMLHPGGFGSASLANIKVQTHVVCVFKRTKDSSGADAGPACPITTHTHTHT